MYPQHLPFCLRLEDRIIIGRLVGGRGSVMLMEVDKADYLIKRCDDDRLCLDLMYASKLDRELRWGCRGQSLRTQ